MCSITGGQLGRICRAIDELAAGSASADRGAGESASAVSEDGTAQAGAVREAEATGQAEAAGQAEAERGAEAAHQAGRDDGDIVRLAAIWEMVAAADPELARRLPGYLSAAE